MCVAIGGVGPLGSGVSGSSPLRLFGFASGLDIDELVGKLMQAERIPLDRLLQQRQLLVWQKQAYQEIRLQLRDLDENTLDLRLSSTFSPRIARSSNESVVKASAQAGAPTGTHTVTVNSLARSMALYSSAPLTSPAGTGVDPTQPLASQFSGLGSTLTLKIHHTVGGKTETAQKTFDTSRDSLQSVISWINGTGFGLVASYDVENDRFFLTSTSTGDRTPQGEVRSYQFEDASGTGFFSSKLSLVDGNATPSPAPVSDTTGSLSSHTGVNADVIVDGASLRFAENTFTLGGITYTLVGTGGPAQVTVSQDTDAIVATVRNFVDLYNKTIEAINQKLNEPRYYDYPPLTEAQKKEMSQDEIAAWEQRAKSGLLRFDPILTDVVSDLRRAVSSPVEITGSRYESLADIGITTGPWYEHGKLYLDEAKLRDALSKDPAAVQALFSQSGASFASRGVGHRIDEALNEALRKLADRAGLNNVEADLTTALGRMIDDLDRRIASMEERLARREAYYYRQFSMMESFIARMNTQALWLAQQLGQGMR